MAEDVRSAAATARKGYVRIAQVLTDEILPYAGNTDAVGRERYERFSRHFLGAVVDLDETYEWGRERLAAIDAEQRRSPSSSTGPG